MGRTISTVCQVFNDRLWSGRLDSPLSTRHKRHARSHPIGAAHSEATAEHTHKPQTVLVTGGLGFIGGHVAAALLSRGDAVHIVDTAERVNYDIRWKETTLRVLKDISTGSLQISMADIADSAAMAAAFAQSAPHVVCHMAARAGVRASLEHPEKYIDTNVKGTAVLLNSAAKHSCNNFVYASSSSVYGERSKDSQTGRRKIDFDKLKESDPADRPLSPYAASKRASELLATVYHQIHGLPTTGLRFFTVYGPRGRPDMVPLKFMKRIINEEAIQQYGDGSSWRDYTYISDVVDGILSAIDNPLGCEVLNMGAGTPVRLADFISTMEETVGCKATIERKEEQLGDVGGTFADISKVKSLLGYEPKVSLKDGLRRTFDWFKHAEHENVDFQSLLI